MLLATFTPGPPPSPLTSAVVGLFAQGRHRIFQPINLEARLKEELSTPLLIFFGGVKQGTTCYKLQDTFDASYPYILYELYVYCLL